MAFLPAENENQHLTDLPQAIFVCVPERYPPTVGTNTVTENFVHLKFGPSLVFVVI